VQTDTTIPNNKPDIIIGDYKEGTCMAIDAAFSANRNVINKEAEKFLQNKDLNKSNTVHVECKKKKSDLRNNKGNCYHSK
jgi:tRNA(Ser,Leu) C12 N-acetylase TAN1